MEQKCNIFKGICICNRKKKCVIGKCITLTNKNILTIAMVCIFSTVLIGSVINVSNSEIDICKTDENMWIPTQEDIRYQDSMYQIIHQTQLEVDTIKDQMLIIIDKLDRMGIADGSKDSTKVKL